MAQRTNLLLPGTARWPADRPVIELEGVGKSFGAMEVLRDVHLTVQTGKTTVISGESGSGKSVLLRMMNGLTLPDTGTVRLFGEDISTISERRRTELRKRCTMVFQNYALIDSLDVAQNIAFPLLQNTRMKHAEVMKLVRDLLELLELPHAFDRMPSDLSGGMKKRVALARAVITNPEVVLFDEPTTGLDPVMIHFVDQLIQRTQREYQITSVIVSHDMASNRNLADHMAILSGGSIVEFGSFEHVQQSTVPAVQRFMANAVTERMGRAEGGEAAGSLAVDDGVPAVAEVVDLHRHFGPNHVLKGITATIPEKKITVVIGGSGSGKSVLIKHIIGLMAPSSGVVKVFGQDLAKLSGRDMQATRARIGMLFQGAALFDSMTVRENIAFPLYEGRGMRGRKVQEAVEEVAERLKVKDLLARMPAGISNGERKRVGLARALITKPDIMVYDEPTTGQDPIMMRRVDDMIVEAAEAFNITSIVISHDMLSTFRIADKIIMIYKGELAAAGTPDQVKASPDPHVQAFIYAGSTDNPEA
ncbi:MAG: ABC transporter ATP-binding protein [Myxococcales bacterium]|nr:ABC transporter ATP-binding protein [Myxococcales bacterium]